MRQETGFVTVVSLLYSTVVTRLELLFSIIAARALHHLLIVSLEYDFRMEGFLCKFPAIEIQQK